MTPSYLLFSTFAAMLLALLPMTGHVAATPADTVRDFMEIVRSGRHPEAVDRFFAPVVQAHQMTSEGESIVARTPAEYAEHVRGFGQAFGPYTLEVEELIAQDDRVFVRWRQQGHHLGSLFGETATGAPLTEIGSAVYRVQDGRIVEYWILLDRKGLELQLERARTAQGR